MLRHQRGAVHEACRMAEGERATADPRTGMALPCARCIYRIDWIDGGCRGLQVGQARPPAECDID